MQDPNKRLDPNEVIDFSKDYYAILGLDPEKLPSDSTIKGRRALAEILETAYHAAAMRTHPSRNLNADPQHFMDVSRAHFILSHPLLKRFYDNEGAMSTTYADDHNPFQVDWTKIGTYVAGTLADSVGFALWNIIVTQKETLGLTPAFFPSEKGHNYEWDFQIDGRDAKLALSLVHDDAEILRLTAGENAGKSLPFKIYVCIPRAALFMARNPNEVITEEDETKNGEKYSVTGTLRGKLRGAAYSDYAFLETTDLKNARAFVSEGGGLSTMLEEFRSGRMVEEQMKRDKAARQMRWMDTEAVKEADAEAIRKVMRARTFQLVQDDTAAQFLDDLPNDKARSAKVRSRRAEKREAQAA